MYKKSNVLFMLTRSPMHCGSGNDLGIVDMPIQRESHTQYPKIESSSLKGAIREYFERTKPEDKDKDKIYEIFGPESGTEYASCIALTDARILLFPVKSVKGVFGWVTSPQIISRFIEDMKIAGINNVQNMNSISANKIAPDSNLIVKANQNGGSIVLEEYTFEVTSDNAVTQLGQFLSGNIGVDNEYIKNKIEKDIVVLPDDEFKNFVLNSTEVITRTKIDDKTGVVAGGALFTEEYLPSETLMYSVLFITDSFKSLDNENNGKMTAEDVAVYFKEVIDNKIIQIGGNTTLGKGLVNIKLV